MSLPTTIPVKFFVAHRMQTRDGSHQIMTTSHCATCHTVSFTESFDEQTRDLIAGAMVQAKALTVDYRFEARMFKDDSPRPTVTPQRHPPVLAARRVPQPGAVRRWRWLAARGHGARHDEAAALAARRPLAAARRIARRHLTKSNTRNDSTRLEIDYSGISGRLVVPVSSRVTFRADARHYDIESDDVFVDVVELTAPAGPSAGLTYRQAFPAMGDQDFVRQSSLSRSPTERMPS